MIAYSKPQWLCLSGSVSGHIEVLKVQALRQIVVRLWRTRRALPKTPGAVEDRYIVMATIMRRWWPADQLWAAILC